MGIHLLFASSNAGKIAEIRQLFADMDVTVVTPKAVAATIEVEETGANFRENAALKAEALARETGLPTLADDSGLLVDALGGEPGIYSARYAGQDKNSERNIDKLLSKLAETGDEDRRAHFVCTLALSCPNQLTHFVEGRCDGQIIYERRGNGGFGYDSVFLIPEYGKTFAELGSEVKNVISHRAKALFALRSRWSQWMGADAR
ncbi:MAG: XTP/dITP diphosphatase [Sporolactobacillus sp.]